MKAFVCTLCDKSHHGSFILIRMFELQQLMPDLIIGLYVDQFFGHVCSNYVCFKSRASR